MISSFRSWLKRQRFCPDAMGVFVNRDFIIRRSLWNAVRRFAPQFSGRLMDFGCGEKPYREAFSVDEYVGVDIEVSGHAPSRKAADVFYDGVTLPFEEASFDGVVTFEVFQAVPNPERIMAEIARVLKPGGRLLVTYPFAWEEVEMPYDLARYTSAGLLGYMSSAGLEVVELEKTPGYLATLTQLFTLWMSHHLLPWSHPWARLVSTALVIAPVNLVGLVMDRLLPKDDRYYHNCVILARKSL